MHLDCYKKKKKKNDKMEEKKLYILARDRTPGSSAGAEDRPADARGNRGRHGLWPAGRDMDNSPGRRPQTKDAPAIAKSRQKKKANRQQKQCAASHGFVLSVIAQSCARMLWREKSRQVVVAFSGARRSDYSTRSRMISRDSGAGKRNKFDKSIQSILADQSLLVTPTALPTNLNLRLDIGIAQQRGW